MKQCAEDMELKLQGNKQSVVFSGIKNIVKTSSGSLSHGHSERFTITRNWFSNIYKHCRVVCY